MSNSIGSIYASMKLNTRGFFRDSRRVQRELKQIDSPRFGRNVAQGFKNVKSQVLGLQGALVGLSGAFVVGDIIQKGAKFEQTMTKVGAVSRASKQELKDLTGIAREMGETTEWSASQAAGGLEFLSMAGFEASQSIKALPGVLNLATAGNIELARAADVASNVLTAMRLPVEELATVNDTFIKTITTANVNMEMMAESFKYAGSIGSAFGYEVQEIAGFIGQLGNAGIQGSMAGTQLAMAFQKSSEVFDTYKLSAEESAKYSRDLMGAIELLEDRGASATEIMEIFGQRAGRGVAALMGVGSDAIKEYTRNIQEASGVTDEVAEKFRKNTIGRWKEFKSVVESVEIDLFESQSGSLNQTLQDMSAYLRENKEEIIDTINSIAEMGKSFTPVIKVIGELISTTASGWNELPAPVQTLGIIGAITYGKKGVAVAAGAAVMGDWAANMGKAFALAADGYIDYTDVIMAGHDKLRELIKTHEEEREAIRKSNSTILEGIRERHGIAAALDFLTRNQERFNESLKEQTSYLKRSSPFDDMMKDLHTVGGLFDDVTENIEEVGKTIKRAVKPDDLDLSGVVDPDEIQRANELIRDMRNPLGELEIKLQEINALYQKGLLDPDQFIRGIEQANEAYLSIVDEQADEQVAAEEKAQSEISKIRDRALESLQDNTSSTFRAMMDEGLDSWETWGDGVIDIAKDTLAEIAALFAQQKIILPIMAQIGVPGASGMMQQMGGQTGLGGLGQLFGGGGGGSGGMNIPGLGSLGRLSGTILPGTTSTSTLAPVGIGPQATGLSLGSALGMGGLGALGYSTIGGAIGLPQGGYSGIGSFAGGALGSWGGAAAGSAMGVGTGAAMGSIVPVIGTAIGAALGGVLGSMFGDETPDDADLQYTFGGGAPPSYDIPGNEYWEGATTTSRIARHIGSGGMREGALGINVKTGDYLDSGQEQELEGAVADYFSNMFSNIEQTFGMSVKDALKGSYAEFQIHDFQEYFEDEGGGLKKALSEMTDQFFQQMTQPLTEAILGGEGISGETLQALQQEGESMGQTFQRVVGVMEVVPDSMRRMREFMEEGASQAEAIQNISQQYQNVSSILAPAIEAGLNASVSNLDFSTFKEGLTGNIEKQMKAAVLATAKQEFMRDLMEGAFDEVGGITDLLKGYFSGDIGLDQLTGQFDQAMNKISAAIDEGAFNRLVEVIEGLGLAMDSTASSADNAADSVSGAGDAISGAARNIVSAASAASIQAQQASIAGTSNQFQMRQIALRQGWYEGGAPSRTELRSQIEGAVSASPREIRERAHSLGISADQYLDDIGTLSDALGDVSQQTRTFSGAARSAASATQDQTSALREQITAIESINNVLNNIKGGGDLAPVQSMEYFRKRYRSLLEEAQGGGAREVGNLTQFTEKYLNFAKMYGGDYKNLAGQITTDMEDLKAGIAGEKTLGDLYEQLESLEQATQSVGSSVSRMGSSIGNSISGIGVALSEALSGIGSGGGGGGGSPWGAEGINADKLREDFVAGVSSAMETGTGAKGWLGGESAIRVADVEGGGYKAEFIGSSGSKAAELFFKEPEEITASMAWQVGEQSAEILGKWLSQEKYSKEDEKDKEGVASPPAGLAAGGFFPGGYRIVGERGPELEATGPSRVHSREDTVALFAEAMRKAGNGGGGRPINLTIQVDRHTFGTIVVDAMKYDENVSDQIIETVKRRAG